MNNPFKISPEKLKQLLAGYTAWLKSDPEEESYPATIREQSKRIKDEFLNQEVLSRMSDDDLYEKIFKYSRELEGPVHMRLGEPRLRGDLKAIKRNLIYIMTSEDAPFMIAQNILDGEYKIEVFAKAFWTPIFQAQFPGVLPNWNNKTEKFFKKFNINLSTSKLSIAEKYRIISEAFTFLSELEEGHDFYTINHLMHYGTVIPEGIQLINELTGAKGYFNLRGFKDYAQYFGSRYDRNSPAVSWLYDTRNKLEHLVTLLSEKLNRNFVINYKERPNNQAGNLKNYVLTGFSPDGVNPDGKLFIKLAFHTLNNNPTFDIEIDVDEKITDNPYRADRERRRDNTRLRIPVDQNFPQDWTTLISSIYDHVELLTKEYNEITGTPTSINPIVPKTSKSMSLNNILYGPPGTGKTYHSINYAVSIVENKPVEDICREEREDVKKRFESYVKDGQIAFCTFHQSLGYEDFIEGIKPVEPESKDEQLSYVVKDGIFKEMCINASFSFVQDYNTQDKEYSYEDKKRIIETLKNEDFERENPKQYVLIIDEINRGNVSQVFGEIITLMEDDKRLGADEALKAILPYSKENFGVPCNLHIIGTMNTADRSVEALDTALRRRFAFINLQPEPDKLTTTEDGIILSEMLSTINNRLEILKDADHTIGHAWLWNVKNVAQLKEVFRVKILPLLQEYFYNDYEKLGLVLGDAFFEPHVQVNSNVFADFSGGNGLALQYDQSWQFRLKPVEKLTISDFKTLTPLTN